MVTGLTEEVNMAAAVDPDEAWELSPSFVCSFIQHKLIKHQP